MDIYALTRENALKALLYELSVTPKPGLVDGRNSGSHADMDAPLLKKSAEYVSACAGECARLGEELSALPPDDAFIELRRAGVGME